MGRINLLKLLGVAKSSYFYRLKLPSKDELLKDRILGVLNKNKNYGHRRITKDKYEEKRKEYRAKQKEINGKTAKLHFADEEYYLTSEYLLKLASNASKLFESSEVHEKRLLLKMTLQNLEIKGKIARYDWINPFDKIAYYASRQAWLRLVDYVRTYFVFTLDHPKEWIFDTHRGII